MFRWQRLNKAIGTAPENICFVWKNPLPATPSWDLHFWLLPSIVKKSDSWGCWLGGRGGLYVRPECPGSWISVLWLSKVTRGDNITEWRKYHHRINTQTLTTRSREKGGKIANTKKKMKDKEKENGKLFGREEEEAAELVTDGSCCPTPFFLNNTRTKWRITNFQKYKNKM